MDLGALQSVRRPHPTAVVANYLILEGLRRGLNLTPLALQKILYYLHGHSYARLGRGAVREPFEAWTYGPVVPSIYQHLKAYGDGPITRQIPTDQPALETIDPELAALANKVLDKYGHLDGGQLVELTHRSGTPWYQVYFEEDEQGGLIPNEVIRSYFVERDRVHA